MSQVAVELQGVCVSPDGEPILEGLEMTVHRGDLFCVLGPSGAGKSTTLRVVAGLMECEGIVTVGGEPPHTGWRHLGFVFQRPRLLPWRSALENVGLGLELRGFDGDRRTLRDRSLAALERVGIGHLAERPAHLLSGGEQQRVAIARALVVDPDILLMDEPFSALDLKTRTQLRRELVEWWKGSGLTVIFVTHDVEEALVLGNRAVVFSPRPGRVAAQVSLDLPYPRTAATPGLDEYRSLIVRHLGPEDE